MHSLRDLTAARQLAVEAYRHLARGLERFPESCLYAACIAQVLVFMAHLNHVDHGQGSASIVAVASSDTESGRTRVRGDLLTRISPSRSCLLLRVLLLTRQPC